MNAKKSKEEEDDKPSNVIQFKPKADPEQPESPHWLRNVKPGCAFVCAKTKDTQNFMGSWLQVLQHRDAATMLHDPQSQQDFWVHTARFSYEHTKIADFIIEYDGAVGEGEDNKNEPDADGSSNKH